MTDELKPCLAHPCDGVMKANLYDASLTCSACQFQVADEAEYSALVAGRQAAIDAALESIVQEIPGGSIIDPQVVCDIIRSRIDTNPLAERDARIAELEAALVDARNSITSWISENEEKIAELESLLGEAYADADDVLRPRIAELEADNTKLTKKLEAGWVRVCQTGLVEAHDRIAELERQLGEMSVAIETGDRAISRNLELERELAEAREDAKQRRLDWLVRPQTTTE